MAPIIEINWVSIFTMLGLLTVIVGIGVLAIKVAVAYFKKNRERE